MATSCPCYNHDDRSAVWSCFDCKPDCVTKFCKECHEHVHSLPVFRFHKTQTVEQGEKRKRRLSQDISDLEKLVAVERDILNGVLTTLRYTEQQEREMLQDIVKKTEQRLHDIQQCHEKVDKALMYLAKAGLGVSTVISSCSTPDISAVPKETPAEQKDQVASLGASVGQLPHFPVDVVGSLNKTGCFWMIKKSTADRQQLAQIDHDLREHFKLNPESLLPSTLKEGTIYVAKSPSNTEFWRIRVEKLCPKEMVKVRYLDYGMQDELPIHCIVDLPPVFKSVLHQAMECSLFPLTAQISLPYEAKWCFKDLTYGKELAARVHSQLIYPQGHRMYHIQLTSAGPPPVNINQKVADLLAEKEQDEEDHPVVPVVPKDESNDQSQTPAVQENKEEKEIEKPNLELKEEKQVEENNITVDQPNTESSPSSIISQDTASQAQEEQPKKITILTRSADSRKDATQKDVSIKPPLDAMTNVTCDPAVTIPEFVPIGYVNEHMYCTIYNECNTNKPSLRNLLSRARYFIVKGNDRQFVETMKTKVWCCLEEGLACTINNAYKDQATKQNALLLIFIMPKLCVGLVRIISEMKRPRPNCTIVPPGLLWGNSCRAEFDIQLFSADKFSFTSLESDSYLWTFLKDSVIGRETRSQKGEEICCKFLRLKQLYSVLDYACTRLYRKDSLPRDNWRSSGENLSKDEDLLPRRSKREDSKTTEDSIANEDWESDNQNQQKQLDALPARVAEIYSNLSTSTTSQNGNSESEKPEENENTGDAETAAVDDDTNITNEEVQEPDEPAVQNPEKPVEVIVEGDDGYVAVEKELVVDEEQSLESGYSQDSIGDMENQDSSGDKPPTIEETQPEADPQAEPSELNSESNQMDSKKVKSPENADEADDTHQNTTEEASHPDKQASTSEHIEPQELIQQPSESADEVIPVQSTANDVNVTKETNPPITSTDEEQLPSYMLVGCTPPRADSPTGLPEDNQQSTEQTVVESVESQEESKQEFYYVISPPQTPSSVTTNNEVPKDEQEMIKMADEEVKTMADFCEEGSLADTVVSASSSISDEPREMKTASLLNTNREYADEDDEKPDYIDEEEAFLPVQPGGRYGVSLTSPLDAEGMFWARIIRNKEQDAEFSGLTKEVKDWAKTSEPLSHVHLLRYCCAKNQKKNYMYDRGLVTKVHRDDQVTVRFIDNGTTRVMPVSELRELHQKFVMSLPPQAFECRLLNKNVFKEKTRAFKKKYFDIEIDVKAITGEVAEVEFVDTLSPSNQRQK